MMPVERTLITKAMVLAAIAGTVTLSVAWTDGSVPTASAEPQTRSFPNQGDMHHALALDSSANTYFVGSGHCNGCHGHDPLGIAMITQDGWDVNVSDHWRSSMMANSARDPYWRAKVSHEVLVNPDHQAILEDKCTSCHAPMGHFEYHMNGGEHYTMSYFEQDDIAFDGVSCTPCHMQSADGIGTRFSGDLVFDTEGRPIYGPYPDEDIFGAPMEAFVNYTPLYGEHIMDAALCAGCHSLITETVDLSGQHTGDTFVEQATYHEWLNSQFNDREHIATGINCQGCHTPQINDTIGVILSANYAFLQPKTPFGLHHFVGGNAFMLNLMSGNGDTLKVTASTAQFDSSIARTLNLLQQHTLLLETDVTLRTEEMAHIDVKLTNLAGHKFPSGFPSRKAWVQLVVTDAGNDTLYNNGAPTADGRISGADAPWQPHYNVITEENQVQVYEMVMGDVEGNYTTVLERAKEPLKDNRLVPAGFSTSHTVYDTTRIVGDALTDPDFNHENGVEGSGTDVVHYQVPMNGYSGLVNITAMVWYHTVPPEHLEDMFTYSSPEIDLFRDMYEAADKAPVLVQSTTITDMTTGIDDLRELGARIFPNPVRDGMLTITGLDGRVTGVEVYDMGGRMIVRRGAENGTVWRTRLPRSGAYVVVIRTAERSFVEKVVYL